MIKRTLTTIAAGAAMLASAQAAVIDLEASADTVTEGQTFEVELTFMSLQTTDFLSEIFGDIEFSDEVFSFVSASFIDPSSMRNELALPADPDDIGGSNFSVTPNGSDVLEVDLFSSNDPDFLAVNQNDTFAAFVLTFEAIAPGTGTVALGSFFELFAGFDEIDAMIVDDSVTVDVNAVPVPAAALLMLPALALLRRRRG